jgi:hypothetical protein
MAVRLLALRAGRPLTPGTELREIENLVERELAGVIELLEEILPQSLFV